MKPLHELLEGWQPGKGRAGAEDPLTAVRLAWAEVAGPEVAANAQPLKIERDALVVVTRSNAWSQQLSFLSERIVADLRARMQTPAFSRLRFRVGRMPATAPALPSRRRGRPAVPKAPARPPSADAAAAIARFRDDVAAYWRAKAASGWKQCAECGAWIEPHAGPSCADCVHRHADRRAGATARLLYETPWLGYEGVAQLVEGLQRAEYEAIRKRLLARWWDTLRLAVRAGRLSADHRERLIASSYVLLKSGIDPERIAPETVRNLLGDQLHDLIYGTEQRK
jgi:hypothetical protein